MIEKPYGRPAIGDVVGYTSKPDFPTEDLRMLVKIEGTMIEIPVEPAKIAFIQRQYPPGSQITLWFYNCGWHMACKRTSKATAPRIGISISELLASHGWHDTGGESESAATEPAAGQAMPDETPEEDVQMATRYINEVELEFKVEAEALLKSIKLAHLNVKAYGKAH